MDNKRIVLKKGREESLKRFHPWIFSGAIASTEGNLEEGDIVPVFSAGGELLACGHYQIRSIAVRVLSFDTSAMMPDFWQERLNAAFRARKASGLPNANTNCYRLVHGEGDGLPGLIIDYYNGILVIQAHSAGMYLSLSKIADALKTIYGESISGIYNKSAGTAPFKAGLDLHDGYLFKRDDLDEDVCVLEHGHNFIVNCEEGQKTGFFLDQRENRLKVENYASGHRVLNLFCYTGGFSVYAFAGGAESVDSVDSSSKAIDLTVKNLELNNFAGSNHREFCEDAIDFLHDSEAGKYDLIIVDPPAFAKHRGAVNNALRAYKRLNATAIEKVAPGGLIFTYSCSQVVDKNAFALAVFSAAAQTGRSVRIIDRLSQPADHPVNIYHPEGEYLKGLLLYVE